MNELSSGIALAVEIELLNRIESEIQSNQPPGALTESQDGSKKANFASASLTV